MGERMSFELDKIKFLILDWTGLLVTYKWGFLLIYESDRGKLRGSAWDIVQKRKILQSLFEAQ